MAFDRFIHFKKNPTWTDLCQTVKQQFPTAEVKCNKPWIAVHFPEMEVFEGHRAPLQADARQRYIELHQNAEMHNVDVMTRRGDPVTNDRADALATLIAQRFNGKREAL